MILPFSRWFAAAFVLFAAIADSHALRIYPVGDSITHGSTAPGGYRSPLYQQLTAAGYAVDMVGSTTVFPDRVLRDAGETHHDGHSGWTISQIDGQIVRWMENFETPDVILIHIGTNDFGGGRSNKTAIDRLDRLMTKIATASPKSHMIVTNLMERGGSADTFIQSEFNPFVEEKINGQRALGRRVSFLDMRAAVPISDMPDRLHPNLAGLTKMADAYFGAILKVIGPPFAITDVNVQPGGVALTWNSRFERPYVIQTSEDQREWTDLPFTVMSGGDSTSATVSLPENLPALYFRVREGLPSSDLLSGATLRWRVPADASLEETWRSPIVPPGAGFVLGEGLSVGFENSPGPFEPLIDNQVREAMQGVSGSIYLRYEFAIPAGRQYRTLEFAMRFDDGFVAYLNGTEIASDNAPADGARWDSEATTGNSDIKAVEFESFDISEFVDLLQPGAENVLAIQGMNKTAGGSDFLIEPGLSGSFEADQP